jgi:hypothetical protein
LRRLDNERQYLKSQLASEITHKNELTKALTACQQQLAEVTRTWHADVETLKETLSNDQREAVSLEQKLKLNIVRLENEENRLKGQNKDLKEAFTKMRDQLRMEQLTIESLHTTQRQLKSEIEQANTEINRLKAAELATLNAHQQTIASLNETISEQDSRRTREIAALREELSKQYNEVSKQQIDALDKRVEVEKARLHIQRHTGVHNVWHVLGSWRRNRVANAFRVWHTNNTLIGVAAQFRDQVNSLIADTLNKCKEDKARALKQQENVHLQSVDVVKQQLNADFDARMMEFAQQAEAHKLHALEELTNKHNKEIEDREDAFYEETRRLKLEHHDAIEKMIQQGLTELEKSNYRHGHDLELAQVKESKKFEEARALLEQQHQEQMKENLKHQANELHTQKLVELNRLRTEHADKEAALQRAHAEQVAQKLRECEQTQLRAIEECEHTHAQEIVKLKSDFEKTKALMEERFVRDMEKKASSVRHEKDVEAEEHRRVLRLEWETELQEKLHAKDVANEELVTKKMVRCCLFI